MFLTLQDVERGGNRLKHTHTLFHNAHCGIHYHRMSRGPEIQLESLAQFVEEKTTVSYKTQAQIRPLGQEVPVQGLPGVGRMRWRKCEDVPVPSCTLLRVSLHRFGTGKRLPFAPSQWGFSSTRHQMLWSKHSALRNLSHQHPLVPPVKSFCEHSGDFFPIL